VYIRHLLQTQEYYSLKCIINRQECLTDKDNDPCVTSNDNDQMTLQVTYMAL